MNLQNEMLYRVAKAGGAIRHTPLMQLLHRQKKRDRDQAIKALIKAGYIESGEIVTGNGGPRPTRYMLTDKGIKHVKDLVSNGWIVDPWA